MTTKKRRMIRNSLAAFCFSAPFGIFYIVFTIWPVIQGVYVSLHKWGLMGKLKYVGLSNYKKFIGDKFFWESMGNTTKLVILIVPALVILSFLLALMANRKSGLRKLLRTCYYIPNVLSVSVISYISVYMFSPYMGFVNGMLHSLGIMAGDQEIYWLKDINLSMVTISIATVWWTLGFSMMLYISALQDIPEQLYEQAEIDGATKTVQLLKITLPLLSPVTYLIAMLQIIASFKIFGQVFMITKGGPGTKTRPIIQYIYETAFTKNDMGYAAAMSYALFFVLIILTLIQLFVQNRRTDS